MFILLLVTYVEYQIDASAFIQKRGASNAEDIQKCPVPWVNYKAILGGNQACLTRA